MNAEAKTSSISIGALLRTFGTLMAFVALVIFFASQSSAFMTVTNWVNIVRQLSILSIVAFTMTLVMAMGDFDLSVGAMASLAGIVAALLFRDGNSVLIGVSAALLVGMFGGIINGFLVSYIGIPPFIATLGMLTVFSGTALYISGGTTIFGRAIPEAFSDFARGGIPIAVIGGDRLEIPNLTLVALGVLALVWLVMEQTVYGRRLYAIGGNEEASRLAGVRVRWVRLQAFVITGIGAALAGLMLVSRLASANPQQGDGLMLNAIAAVFLGMTMSEEGEPHVLGTLVGVLILQVLANGLTLLSIDSYIQQIITGAIIVLAVVVSSLSKRLSR